MNCLLELRAGVEATCHIFSEVLNFSPGMLFEAIFLLIDHSFRVHLIYRVFSRFTIKGRVNHNEAHLFSCLALYFTFCQSGELEPELRLWLLLLGSTRHFILDLT